MPSPVGHTLAGYFIYESERKIEDPFDWKKMGIFVFVSNLPDMHYVPALLLGNVDRFHYPFLHSFCLGGIVAGCVYSVLKIKKSREALYWGRTCFFLYSAHILLDYLCKNNYPSDGLVLFWPFSDDNYTAPIHLFADLQKGHLGQIFSWFNFSKVLKEILVLSVPIFLMHLLRFKTACWRPSPTNDGEKCASSIRKLN